jgi:3-deoxy-D-manno-octulosonic acid (KDO) 8-phosphate synthase
MDEEEIFYNHGLSDEELFAGMVFTYGEQEMLSKIHPCSTITKDDLIHYLYDSSFDFPDDTYLF